MNSPLSTDMKLSGVVDLLMPTNRRLDLSNLRSDTLITIINLLSLLTLDFGFDDSTFNSNIIEFLTMTGRFKIFIKYITILLYLSTASLNAQILKDTSSVMLIKKSIDYIYNYQFKDAEQACSEISILFPGHPVEYLLKGMITYWENFPLLTNSPARVLFEKDLRTCIEICEKIPDSIDEPEYLLTNLCAR